MDNIIIVVRNTHFAVTITKHSTHASIIRRFNSNLITYQTIYVPHLRRMRKIEDRRFYSKAGDYTYHYSIQLLGTFIKRLLKEGLTKDDVTLIEDKEYSSGSMKVRIQSKYKDRDHQPLYIKKALSTNPLCLIDLKTGKGKTYISMRVATKLRYPTGIVVLSRYIEKWIGDIKELTTATDDDIYVVQGKDSLSKLLASGNKYPFVIFSQSTLRNYIKGYDEYPDNYDCPPERLFERLGLGMMLNDEVHQSFHAGYMIAIRTNPLKVVSLSATLDSLNSGLVFMYGTLYPEDSRCGNLVEFKPHPIVVAVNYFVDDPDKLPSIGARGYSHTLFEQGILRNSIFRRQYLEMILHYVTNGYIDRRRNGDKLLVFVQTINMATLITNYLRSKFPKLKIGRYVEEDPYENLMESDICISTNGSAGAAVDIPNLITVLQTVSIGSLQANIQALGRLREIKGVDVMYYYTYSSNINGQQKLHNTRKDVIQHLVKEYRFMEYPKRL